MSNFSEQLEAKLDSLKIWMVQKWGAASCLDYPELAVALIEYTRCRRIARDEYDRWINYEDLHKR